MRIKAEEIAVLKSAIHKRLPDASIYLFGSRIDDSKKGGDIDILVLSSKKLTLVQKAMVRMEFFKQLGEQKLDLISYTYEEESNFKNLMMLDAQKI